MAISIVDTSPTATNTDTGADPATLSPFSAITGITTGDLAIMGVSALVTANGPTTLTGWTQLHEVGQASPQHSHSYWYRVVQSGDTTSTTFSMNFSGTPDGQTYVCSAYRGVDTTDPFIVQAGSTISTDDADDAIATPSVTSGTMKGQWWVSIGLGSDVGDTTVTISENTGTDRASIDGADATNRIAGIADSAGEIAVSTAFSTTWTVGAITGDGDLSAWIGILRPAGIVSNALMGNRVSTVRRNYW